MNEDDSPVAEVGNMLHGAIGGRLRDLFDELPAAVVVLTGPNHHFQYFNRRFTDIFGSDRQFIGLPLREVLPHVEAQGFADLLDQVYASGEPFHGKEVPTTLPGRSELSYFDFVYLPTRDKDGQVDGVLAHGVDVTDVVTARNRADQLAQQLHFERAQLATVIEHIPAGVVIADTSAKILSANSAYYQTFDIPVDEVEGIEAWRRFQGVRPDGTPYEPHEYPLVRTVFTAEEVAGEHIVIRREGQPDRVLEISSAPIFDDNGDLASGVAVFTDVTERLATQARTATEWALGQAQIRLDKVLEAAGDGIIVLDPVGKVTLINPSAQKLTGYGANDIIGRAIHPLVHHSHADGSPYSPEDCPIVQNASEGRECQGEDDLFWRRDGTSFPVSYQSTPVYEADTQIGSVLVFRDLTERRKVEAARGSARQAEVSQRQALELNDDIMQDLTVIQLSLDMGRTADARKTVTGTIESMKAMINRLLESAESDDLSSGGAFTRQKPARSRDHADGVRQ